ncbi:hypothetical protein Trydic_g20485 [Trypoxylus dichotomus]
MPNDQGGRGYYITPSALTERAQRTSIRIRYSFFVRAIRIVRDEFAFFFAKVLRYYTKEAMTSDDAWLMIRVNCGEVYLLTCRHLDNAKIFALNLGMCSFLLVLEYMRSTAFAQ